MQRKGQPGTGSSKATHTADQSSQGKHSFNQPPDYWTRFDSDRQKAQAKAAVQLCSCAECAAGWQLCSCAAVQLCRMRCWLAAVQLCSCAGVQNALLAGARSPEPVEPNRAISGRVYGPQRC
jgi:hypothetical protein